MKFVQVIAFCVLIASTSALLDAAAEPCTPAKCKIADGCVCSSPSSPLPKDKTPQFVTLTFDDSISEDSYLRYYKEILFGRKNADGSPISSTFYVPHVYTDYQAVNNLYNGGFEIAVNSITKDSADYFATASQQELIDEFDGQRKIVSTFANISIANIKGARTPHFQLAGDKTFEAYKKAGLEYDNSWVALSQLNFFPYTLDYKSTQPCSIGKCPTSAFPKFWIVPVNNFVGKHGQDCNVLFSCGINGTAAQISNWLIEKHNSIRSGTRAPINLLINTAWFQLEKDSFEGIKLFLNYLTSQKDTFVVSHAQLISWAKNPKPLGEYKPVISQPFRECSPRICPLPFGDDEIRYMKSCVPCPNVYPWLKNPEGN
jgi:hypothetical protein